MRPPLVVDQHLIYDQRTARWQRRMRLSDQCDLRCQVPVMQDHAHDERIRRRQLIAQEVPRNETHALRYAMRLSVAAKARSHFRQVETSSAQVRMHERKP